ncbi:MAG: hypothetical protein F4Y34_08375 [Gammaproteobacteria bacterium]|nr:hypothetical protein [Gammaproteobacteria bacterium]
MSINTDTEHPVLLLTVELAAKTGKNILVDESGAIAGAESNALGPTRLGGQKDDRVPVTALGVATCVSGAAFAKGDLLKAGAGGKVVKAANNDAFGDQSYVGRALLAASGANKKVPVMLIQN